MGKQVTHFPTLAIYGPVPGAGRSGDLWTRAGASAPKTVVRWAERPTKR
jgi:hypothetical protein